MGLLAGENDYELMEKTHYDRNISRHNYTVEEIQKSVKKPVVQKLKRLMQFRNEYPVFDGEMFLPETEDYEDSISWKDGRYQASLNVNLISQKFTIQYLEKDGTEKQLSLDEDFELR